MELVEILFTIIIGLSIALIFKSFHHSFDKAKMHVLEMDLEIAQAACEGYENSILSHAKMVDEFTVSDGIHK
jgi:hypothetical protein